MKKILLICGIALVSFSLAVISASIYFGAAKSSKSPILAQQSRDDSEPRGVTTPEDLSSPQADGKHPVRGGRRGGDARHDADMSSNSKARELVAVLTRLDPKNRKITPQEAEQWKQALADLRAQGASAVPAIREFLETNQEFSFAGIHGGAALGESSLRAAMIDTLHGVGGPEAQELMVETLKVTALPSEIALLAARLEEEAPGKFRQQAMDAAKEVRTMAARDDWGGWDVGPLFQMAEQYESATAVSVAQELGSKYRFYSALTLAELKDGSGVPALIQEMQVPSSALEGPNYLALQVLAQIAVQYPSAGEALLQQASQGKLSEVAWKRIAAGLSGEQYTMIPISPSDMSEVGSIPGMKAYHMESGNQNLFSVPVSAIATADQIEQRRLMIDRLMAAKPGPAAEQILKEARAWLSAVIAAK